MTEFDLARTKKVAEAPTLLPKPAGYKILCAIPKVDENFRNSQLIKSEKEKYTEEQTTVVLFVLKLGPDAYKDPVKFPSGPLCKEGDFIITRAYSGTRIKIFGNEMRLINDDTVEAVVDDPRGIAHA